MGPNGARPVWIVFVGSLEHPTIHGLGRSKSFASSLQGPASRVKSAVRDRQPSGMNIRDRQPGPRDRQPPSGGGGARSGMSKRRAPRKGPRVPGTPRRKGRRRRRSEDPAPGRGVASPVGRRVPLTRGGRRARGLNPGHPTTHPSGELHRRRFSQLRYSQLHMVGSFARILFVRCWSNLGSNAAKLS